MMRFFTKINISPFWMRWSNYKTHFWRLKRMQRGMWKVRFINTFCLFNSDCISGHYQIIHLICLKTYKCKNKVRLIIPPEWKLFCFHWHYDVRLTIWHVSSDGKPVWEEPSLLWIPPLLYTTLSLGKRIRKLSAYKNNNQACGSLGLIGFVQLECTVPLGTSNFWNFKPEFLVEWKVPLVYPLEHGHLEITTNQNFAQQY